MSSFIRTSDHLTVMFDDGESVTIYNSDPRFREAVKAVRNEEWDRVRALATPAKAITEQFEQRGTRVEIKNGTVYLNGKAIHNTLTQRMVQMVEEGFDVDPTARFLENLMENPSYRAVNELYTFMEKSDLPITKDGHFIAYKRVRNDYKDIFSGKIDNSIGATPSMPRNEVDEDKNQPCSKGLHFCSRSYLSSYGTGEGNRSVIVKINPRDVVSIPADYNNAKGRCCLYEVVGELEHSKEKELEGAYFPDEDDLPEYVEEIEIEFEEWEREFGEDIDTALSTVENLLHPNYTQARDENRTIMGSCPWIAQIDPRSNRVIATFRTAREAQNRTLIDSSSIMKVCRGKRKTAGGYHWKFLSTVASQDPNSDAKNFRWL